MAQLLLTKDVYSPAVSSPLNPSSCYQIPTKPHRSPRGKRIIHRAAGTPSTPLSPTQQLLRQKAQVAWRSEVLRHAVRRPSTPTDCADASALEALTYIHQQQEKHRHHQRSYLGDVTNRGQGKAHPLAGPRRESCPADGDMGVRVGVREIVEESEPGEKEPLLSNDDDVFRVDLGRAIEAAAASPSGQAESEPKRRRPPVGVRIVRRVVLALVLFSVFVVVPCLRVRALYKRHFGS